MLGPMKRTAAPARFRSNDVHVVFGADVPEKGWRDLAARNDTPMQAHAWTAATAALDPEASVNVVLGDPHRPDGIMPLTRTGTRPTRLELTAGGEPIDALYRDEAALTALCDGVAALRLPVRLRRLLASSPTARELTRAYARRGLVVHRQTNPYPATELDDSWREPERKFNSGRRSDIRRAQRRAQALGEVAFALQTPDPDDVDALLDEAVAVEAAGWKGRAGTSMATDDAEREFFRHWAPLAARDGALRIAFMRIDGRPVAMQLAAETGGRLWLFKIGYDESVSRCSPGNLLMLEVVRDAAERGLESVEFLGRREGWTQLWSTVERPCIGVAAYPVALASVPALAADALARYRARRQEARTEAAKEHANGS